ncbi:MAG: RidA family protein [Burkholderiales bacterium]
MAKTINVGVAAKIGKYSDAVLTEAGKRQLHVSGTPGIRKDGSVPDTFEEQADLAWRNLLEILEASGMGPRNLVKITQYMVRAEHIAAYPAIRIKYLGDHRPASMLSVVTALVKPEILFEIEAIATE